MEALYEAGCQAVFRAHLTKERDTCGETPVGTVAQPNPGGFKFSRQVPIGPYIVDFACREQRLIVEVDGATHSTEEELAHDNRRTEFLKSEGNGVIRFQNDEVLNGMDEVLTLILQTLRNRPLP